ncbi:hypothetical protein DFH29DRAFT_879711 [Suillus ampliporus]|nr:hypothetical protein DFH29DRAFT_879711 [Suillus ampliporus]
MGDRTETETTEGLASSKTTRIWEVRTQGGKGECPHVLVYEHAFVPEMGEEFQEGESERTRARTENKGGSRKSDRSYRRGGSHGRILCNPHFPPNTLNITDPHKAIEYRAKEHVLLIGTCFAPSRSCLPTKAPFTPNIPSPKDSLVRILRRRLGIMVLALLAPELITAWAMHQWISACYVTSQFKKHFGSQNNESTKAPAEQPKGKVNILACILNIFPYGSPASQDHGSTRLLAAHTEGYEWTQTHSFFVIMGGFMLYVDGEPYRTLSPDDLLKLLQDKHIDVPTLTAKQISDRSKGNTISKGLVMLQAAWFVLQLISRAVYHLETTLLETGTLAFVVLNFITYAGWWNKPLDVQCPYPVYCKVSESRLREYFHKYVCA